MQMSSGAPPFILRLEEPRDGPVHAHLRPLLSHSQALVSAVPLVEEKLAGFNEHVSKGGRGKLSHRVGMFYVFRCDCADGMCVSRRVPVWESACEVCMTLGSAQF